MVYSSCQNIGNRHCFLAGAPDAPLRFNNWGAESDGREGMQVRVEGRDSVVAQALFNVWSRVHARTKSYLLQ